MMAWKLQHRKFKDVKSQATTLASGMTAGGGHTVYKPPHLSALELAVGPLAVWLLCEVLRAGNMQGRRRLVGMNPLVCKKMSCVSQHSDLLTLLRLLE
jgi:hypothetical protein